MNLLVLRIGVVLAAVFAGPQAGSEPPWMPKLQGWLSAVDAHRPGVRDAPAETIGAWKNADLDAIAPYIEVLIELLPDPDRADVATRRTMKEPELAPLRELARREAARGGVNRIMKRGAVLHADAMITGAAGAYQRISEDEARREERAKGRVMVLGIDGAFHGYAVTPRHWTVARLLLDGVHPDPASDDFVRLWYRATSAYLLMRSQWSEAERQLRHEGQRLTPNGRAHLDMGCVYEAYAHPRVQTLVSGRTLSDKRKYDVQSVAANLELAQMHFAQAVALDAALVEARIRLARVRTLLGKADKAVADLEAASIAATEPPVRYYAALFLGDAEQALGRHDAARQAYRRASELYPSSQAPHLALSMLAREGGDTELAQSALASFLSVPASAPSRHDPWWYYYMGSGRNVNALADQMWKALPDAEAK